MKKILSLFSLLVAIVTGASATDVVTFSSGTWTGGAATYTSKGSLDSNKLKLESSDATGTEGTKHVQVVLSSGTFQTGDAISITYYASNTSKSVTPGFFFGTIEDETFTVASSIQANETSAGSSSPATQTNLTVPEAANGSNVLRLTRYTGGTTLYITAISITRTAAVKPNAPGFTPNGGADVEGKTAVSLTGTASSFYYQWSTSGSEELTPASEGWNTGASTTVPNVIGTYYLYAYASNGATLNSDVVKSNVFNVTSVSTSHVITAAIADGQSSYGTIDKAGDNEVDDGGSLTITAAPKNEQYGFVNWTKDDVEVSTNRVLELTDVHASATYVAHFKKVIQVKWDNTSSRMGTNGKQLVTYQSAANKPFINEIYADEDDKFTIPAYADKYYYHENGDGVSYVFNKWKIKGDTGSDRYNSGDEVTIPSNLVSDDKVTFEPTFTACSTTLADALSQATAETTVTWAMGSANIIFRDWQDNEKYGYYVANQNIQFGGNTEKFAFPIKMYKGKIANYGRTDALVQLNQNTTITIPAVSGMVVTLSGAYQPFGAEGKTATTIAGSSDYTTKSADGKTVTYRYDGTDATIDVVMGNDAQYITTLQVVYPAAPTTETITTDNDVATYVTKHALDFTGLETKAYVVTGVNAGKTKVLTQEVTTVPAGTALLVKGATVDVPVVASATAPATNLFLVSDGSVEQNTDKTIFVYSKTAKAFKRLGTATIPNGKCYITIEGVPEATNSLDVDIEGEATAITNVNANENANSAAPVKIIKNGKLYIGNYNVAGQQVK